MHAGIPGTHLDSALQALIGGVVGGAATIISAIISIIITIVKMKDTCCQGGRLPWLIWYTFMLANITYSNKICI